MRLAALTHETQSPSAFSGVQAGLGITYHPDKPGNDNSYNVATVNLLGNSIEVLGDSGKYKYVVDLIAGDAMVRKNNMLAFKSRQMTKREFRIFEQIVQRDLGNVARIRGTIPYNFQLFGEVIYNTLPD